MEINLNIKEEMPLIKLTNSDYNNYYYTPIYTKELLRSKQGDVLVPVEQFDLCSRGMVKDKLIVLYKYKNKVLCLLETIGTTDEMNPKDWEEEELILFSLGK